MNAARLGLILLSLLLLIPLAVYAVKAAQFLPLDQVRSQATNQVTTAPQYFETSLGKIAYRLHFPTNTTETESPLVVLVHGFSTPQFVFDPIVKALTSAGHKVLTFDHLGRGFSDRPDGRYDEVWYRRELQEVVAAFTEERPFHLVGYSMGGANVISYTARHPEQVASITLLAPAGFVPEYSGITRLLLSPTWGPLLLTAAGRQSLAGSLEKDVEAGTVEPSMLAQFDQQFFIKGTPLALARTLQNYPMYDLSHSYYQAGSHQIPTTVVWGENDEVTPATARDNVQKAIPHSVHHVLANADHSLTYVDADRVAPLILQNLATFR